MRFEKPTTNAYRELPYSSLWWVFPEGDDARRVQTSVPNASEPTWPGSRHIDPCFVFMCVCAQRTGTSLPLYGTSAADCTATGPASPVRPRLALGGWASNPLWPMGRRALRAKRGASAKETAEACRSGGPRTSTEPIARGALDEPSTRNAIRQPPRGRQIVTGGGDRRGDRRRDDGEAHEPKQHDGAAFSRCSTMVTSMVGTETHHRRL